MSAATSEVAAVPPVSSTSEAPVPVVGAYGFNPVEAPNVPPGGRPVVSTVMTPADTPPWASAAPHAAHRPLSS